MPLNMYVLGFTNNRPPPPLDSRWQDPVAGHVLRSPLSSTGTFLAPVSYRILPHAPKAVLLPTLTSCPNSSLFLTSSPSYSFYNCPGARGRAEVG